ncbi:MAG: ATP-dependent DNA helicase RecG [Candidatus Melainabacteria bacterium GWF2_32_7]|nr:MAG: ATP-dependent DNA helicase RecG [Candidatus Melainabacteria bacterium GWF2_32_7]
MTEVKKIENLDLIKKAIEVEIKHHYIDIVGKKCAFSKFIYNELRQIAKIDPHNPKWEYLYNVFERYAVADLSTRMKSIKQLIKHLQNPFCEEKTTETAKKIKTVSDKNPEDVDVMYVKGVGPKVGFLLNKLGIFTAQDLLHYYPRKHLDYAERTPIKDLKIGQEVTIFGTIKSTNVFSSKKRSNLTIISIQVTDDTGIISASWFYGKANKFMLERYKSQYPQGANIILSGTVKLDSYTGRLVIDKAQSEILSGDFEEKDSLHVGRIVPVYALTENLNIKTLRRAIYNAIEVYSNTINDFLPEYIIEKLGLTDKVTAIKQIHFPDSSESLERAKRRLIFDELFLIQLRLALMRKQYKSSTNGLMLNIKKDGLVDKFIKSLPFELTNAQKEAFNEIVTDLSNPEPMQRLLQGDVGSGKTVVAGMSLLAAVENNYQGAIMAPTEILAEQHYKNFTEWLTPLGISVGLFVGKHGVKIRRELHQNLKNGQINVAVGTHALIQENIEFNNLGLVVIDEQHRFGVRQRSELKNKGTNPEMLTMTATPIPRTLALTMHGDFDITIINELPPGRKPIKTALISPKDRKKAHTLIRKEIEKGHQAYIVFPLIEESETLSAKAATKEAEKLQKTVFPDLNIGLVHGKLPPAEKDKVMEEFRAGKYHILVSTTVIEVGVDVPNATVMIIENAERFGLSQLHQLRGRVGRSQEQSYCVLVGDTNSQETRERLEVMVQTNNGFVIAEKDLQIRGPGEFIGTRQSGLPDLILADLVKDAEILELARETAFAFVAKDEITNYPLLNKIMNQKIDEGLELIGAG